MKIIISPTKKMKVEEVIPPLHKPLFLSKTEELLSFLRSRRKEELEEIWKVKKKLLEENITRLEEIDLTLPGSPAIFSYDGIQFTYMSPSSFTDDMLSYAQKNVRIISGFYGLLRPMDGIVPYRLEMESKININGKGDLYSFWGDTLASEIEKEDDLIVNLASLEYSKAIIPHLKKARVVTPVFLEENNGKLVTKGVYAKMARGEMVRYLCEEKIDKEEGIKDFSLSSYTYSPQNSTPSVMAFVRK